MPRDVWLRLWNWWHGYPRGSIEELPGGGTRIILQTGRKRGNWVYDEYKRRNLHLNERDDPCWPDIDKREDGE